MDPRSVTKFCNREKSRLEGYHFAWRMAEGGGPFYNCNTFYHNG